MTQNAAEYESEASILDPHEEFYYASMTHMLIGRKQIAAHLSGKVKDKTYHSGHDFLGFIGSEIGVPIDQARVEIKDKVSKVYLPRDGLCVALEGDKGEQKVISVKPYTEKSIYNRMCGNPLG